MRIGERLRELCAASGLSIHELEHTAGLKTGYLSRVIEGAEVPTCDTLGRLAAALEVPVARLFREEGEVVSTPKLTPRLTLEQLAQDGVERRAPLLHAVLPPFRGRGRPQRSS
jgi:transcriptional regulator with XRE-family HTH domain